MAKKYVTPSAIGFCLLLGIAAAHSQPVSSLAQQPATAFSATSAEAPPRPIPLSGILETELIGKEGVTLGEIERAVERRAGEKRYFIVSRGGFLGMFEHEYLVPVAKIAMRGGRAVARDLTLAELEKLPQFSSYNSDYRELDETDTVILSVVN